MSEQRTDPLVTPKKNEVVPHYLRPSSGSCHDFCKYGRKHVFEEKPWKSSRKRTAKLSHSELATVEIFVSGEPKKEKILKHKLSIDTNKHSLNPKLSPGIKSLSPKPKISLVAKSHSPRRNASSGDNKKLPKCKSSSVRKSFSPDPPEVIKREILPPPKQVEVPVQEGFLIGTKQSRTKKRTGYRSDKQSPSLRSKPVKVKVPLSSFENLDGKGRNGDVKTGRKMTDSKTSAKKALKSTAAPLCPKVPHTKKVSIITRKTRSSKLVSPVKDQNRLVRVERKTSDEENVPEKTLHVIETGTQSDFLDSISDEKSGGKSPSLLSLEKHDDEIDNKGGDVAELVSSDNVSLKDEKAEPVTENGKKTLLKSRMILSDDAAELVSSDDVSLKDEKAEPVTENGKKTLIKSRMILSDDKNPSPVKLKFRSGKVVDLMLDNNNPRRLKFRKRKVVGAANSKADVSSKNYKRTGDDGATDAKLSSEKVLLKHQDVQGKKDDQRLFNNVIEETASKLVKSRKSKVKALVGAFETVISLQEKTLLHPVS